MPDTISVQEPSETLRANPSMMRCFEGGHLPLEECERRARGAIRLSEAFSSIPWHVQRAAKDPDYWNELYSSRANW